jgi:hypothetical protein
LSRRKVLLDECVDRRLATEITGHDVRTVPEAGWASIKNGALLGRAQDAFDVFITTDRNLMFQQNLPKFDIAVIVLAATTNRLQDLIPLVPRFCTQFLQPSLAIPLS